MNAPLTFSERLGALLVLWLTTSSATGAVALALHLPLSPLILLLAFAAGVAWLRPRDGARRATAAVIAAALIVIVGSLALASTRFDLSYDGQTYHQVAVRALAGGWNPVWNAVAAESMPNGLHVFSLPKAAWIVEAMLYRGTGLLEAAKGIHLIAMVAALLFAFSALVRLGTARGPAIAVAIFAAAGPVTITQLFTFHVDGIVASGVVIVVSLVVLYFKVSVSAFGVPLILASAFLANLKFPGLVYAALIAALTMAAVAIHARQRLRPVVTMAGFAAVLALVEGINPYVTNTVFHGHPAYPAAGSAAMNLAPLLFRNAAFTGRSRPEQLARSILSRSSDDFEKFPVLKFPLTIGADEAAAFTTVDTRIAGWGPLFGAALILSWALLLPPLLRGERRAQLLAACSAAALASALLVPFGFYARYTPQLWLACLPALLLDDLRSWRTRTLGVIVALNLLLVGTVSLGTHILDDRLHRQQLQTLARDAKGGVVTVTQAGPPFVNVDLHLDAYRIAHRDAAAAPCAEPALLLRTHAMLCLPNGQSPAKTPDPLVEIKPLLSAIGLETVSP